MKQSSFPRKDFLRKTAVIAVPVALQNLLTTTGSMVDTMMIASLGQTQVGAVGLCAQFSSLMFSGYWGFVGGGMLFFSQYWGAGDDDGINRSYGLTLTCMMSVGILFGILAVVFPEAVMRLYTDKEAIRRVGAEYLRIAGFAYPLMVFSMAMASLLRCTDRVRIPLYASIVSVCTNIFLNWILIFGHFGMPALGVRGAAIATVTAQAAGIAVTMLLAVRSRHAYLLAVKAHFRWTVSFVQTYLKKCFPIIMNEVLIGVGNMVINVVLGRQPEEAIAALAVFRTLEGLVIGFFAGFSNAASVLVGTKVGAGDPDTAYKRAWRLVYLCQWLHRNDRHPADCAAFAHPLYDGHARRELPDRFRDGLHLCGSFIYPHGKLDTERYLPRGRGCGVWNPAGDHFHVGRGGSGCLDNGNGLETARADCVRMQLY